MIKYNPLFKALPTLAKIARASPHRLAAQDGALSRLKQGFESPWGHYTTASDGGFFSPVQPIFSIAAWD